MALLKIFKKGGQRAFSGAVEFRCLGLDKIIIDFNGSRGASGVSEIQLNLRVDEARVLFNEIKGLLIKIIESEGK